MHSPPAATAPPEAMPANRNKNPIALSSTECVSAAFKKTHVQTAVTFVRDQGHDSTGFVQATTSCSGGGGGGLRWLRGNGGCVQSMVSISVAL